MLVTNVTLRLTCGKLRAPAWPARERRNGCFFFHVHMRALPWPPPPSPPLPPPPLQFNTKNDEELEVHGLRAGTHESFSSLQVRVSAVCVVRGSSDAVLCCVRRHGMRVVLGVCF